MFVAEWKRPKISSVNDTVTFNNLCYVIVERKGGQNDTI